MPEPNNSPAAVLDLLLDKGIILPPSTNICCPPCNPYVLASVETNSEAVKVF
jgi:hypothetical protein